MLSYVRRDLLRNPRRTLASLAGVALGVGLFSGVLFFIDGSGASMTKRAIAPLTLDMQRVLTSPLGGDLRFAERVSARGRAAPRAEGEDHAHGRRTTAPSPPTRSWSTASRRRRSPTCRGTTTLNGQALRDVAGQSPLAQGLARSGLNIGTVRARGERSR